MAPEGVVEPGLDTLSSTDRGFVTWVATFLGEPVEALWARLIAGGTRVDGRRIAALNLTPVGRALRERMGSRPLQLPMAGLAAAEIDVSGMDLDQLDVRLLPQLRILRCADNRLKTLDLSQSANLQVLDVTGNELMTLEVGDLRALTVLRCAGNGLAVLVLPAGGAIEQVDASRNQLMVLELPALPALRELNLYRNALARFVLADAPALERLDLGRNELDALTLPHCPRCVWLSVARNRLDHLDLTPTPAVRELKCHGNYLEALDLRPVPALTRLEAKGNQIRTLLWPAPCALDELDLSDNHLEEVALAGPKLSVARLAGNELRAVSADACPVLLELDVSHNALESLDLAQNRALVDLRCAGNPLSSLDVTPLGQLVRLTSRDGGGRGPHVLAGPDQVGALSELRGPGPTDPATMGPWHLHELAARLTGRDGDPQLRVVVEAKACDLGTLLLVYWTNTPRYYLKYAARDDVPEFERVGWDLLRAIEARVASGSYSSATIPFDPACDRSTRSVRGVDWTADDRRGPRHGEIPAYMRQRSGPDPDGSSIRA